MQSIVRKFIRKIARKEINYEVKLSYVTGALAHIAGYHAAGNKGCMISTINLIEQVIYTMRRTG